MNDGWENVTIRKIADTIDYTAPVVYEHFKNKDDLYYHLVKDGFRILREKTMEAIDSGNSPEEKLMAIAEVKYDFALKRRTLHQIMYDSEKPEWQKAELSKSIQELKPVMDQVISEISGRPEKAGELGFNLMSLIKGYTFFSTILMSEKNLLAQHFPADEKILKKAFKEAVQRYIKSIRNL